MKEYEYMVLVTNEIFSHMISSVICLENYYNRSIGNSFKIVFHMFNEFRDAYKTQIDKKEDESIQMARAKACCRLKREEILKSFIEELKELDNSIDYEKKIKSYYERIQQEDVETLEMQLMVYPYLMSLIRKNEEGKGEQDGEESG